MKTAVIYARYSSDSQTEQSIEGQLRVCQEYAKNNEILIVGTYIDRAMTGTNDLRPDFQQMIRDSDKKQWDYVIVYKLDRFSRNKYETTIHKHTLSNNGVKVLSAMENIPDTPEGIILESLLEGMNQYYSVELSQKIHRGLNESYIKGQYTGGIQLYGYDTVDKKNVINPAEAEVVKEIFNKYAKGFTGVQIVKDLKSRGIRNKKGNYIKTSQIYQMIFNRKYIGEVEHNGKVYTNIYPAILDKETFQSVQDIRKSNKYAPGRKKDIYDFLLSGKVTCGYCGVNVIGDSGTSRTGHTHFYYSCLNRRKRHLHCELKSISKQYLEDFVMKVIWQLLSEKNNIAELAEQIAKKHEEISNQGSNLKTLENQRAGLSKAADNLISAIEQGIITEQTKTRLKELEKQISQLDFDIEQEKQRSYAYLTERKIADYLQSIISGDIDNIEVRKTIIKIFVKEIIVFNDKIIIIFNFTDRNFVTALKPQSKLDYKELVNNLNSCYNNYGSSNDVSVPPNEIE